MPSGMPTPILRTGGGGSDVGMADVLTGRVPERDVGLLPWGDVIAETPVATFVVATLVLETARLAIDCVVEGTVLADDVLTVEERGTITCEDSGAELWPVDEPGGEGTEDDATTAIVVVDETWAVLGTLAVLVELGNRIGGMLIDVLAAATAIEVELERPLSGKLVEDEAGVVAARVARPEITDRLDETLGISVVVAEPAIEPWSEACDVVCRTWSPGDEVEVRVRVVANSTVVGAFETVIGGLFLNGSTIVLYGKLSL